MTHQSNQSQNDPTAVEVHSLVPLCAVCGLNTRGHKFAQIAMTIISENNRERVLALHSHTKSHEWDKLSTFRDFDPNLDTVVVYVIKGEHPDGTVLLIRDPTEYWSRAELYLKEVVTAQAIESISRLVDESGWREL